MLMNKDCWADIKYFKPSEFKCNCGCEKEHTKMDCKLINLMDSVRKKYGVTTITSGYRCKSYNDSLVKKGYAISNSAHTKGKACDFYVKRCDTEKGRLEVMEWLYSQPDVNYTYGNVKNNHKNMGTSIHVDII